MKKKIFALGFSSLFLIVLSISGPPTENEEPFPQELDYQICCGNLEHFSPTAKRGFPEVSSMKDHRSEEQLNVLAAKIRDEKEEKSLHHKNGILISINKHFNNGGIRCKM